MSSRREFLKNTLRHGSLISLAPVVPGFLARTSLAVAPKRGERVLVVVFLEGGNDGINTVVPFGDEGYKKHRKRLRLPSSTLIKLNDHVGLHNSLSDVAKLWENNQLAIVQGVAYPNPNLSHFHSMAVWHTARLKDPANQSLGWIGSALDAQQKRGKPQHSVFLGDNGKVPMTLRSRRSACLAINRLDEYRLDPAAPKIATARSEPKDGLADFVAGNFVGGFDFADRVGRMSGNLEGGANFPATPLAQSLKLAAQLIKADTGARVYYAPQAGYDTHNFQLNTHRQLLSELGGAIGAFLGDLKSAGVGKQVCVLVVSEFGRRVKENGSEGTDHGTAGPVFLAGESVRGGLIGKTPSLTDLHDGNLKWSIDFRQVYASLLEKWLEIPSRPILGEQFDTLPIV